MSLFVHVPLNRSGGGSSRAAENRCALSRFGPRRTLFVLNIGPIATRVFLNGFFGWAGRIV